MIKLLQFLVICTMTVAFGSSIARAQTYKQVDVPFPGAILTELGGGPNPQGTSVGTWRDAAGVFHGFSLTADGVFTSFDPPGSTFTQATFISPQGVIVGLYLDSSSVSHGFILVGGKYTTVDAHGVAGTALSGISPLGEISGFTCSDPACGNLGAPNTSHSFVRSTTGVFTIFDPPGAISSAASTVSPTGEVVGAYTDNAGNGHGYLFNQGKFTTIDFPGATFTFIGGGNPEGDVVGLYIDAAGASHAYMLHNGVFTSFDYPEVGVQFTVGTGINPGGVIVGVFQDSSGGVHGFIRTP